MKNRNTVQPWRAMPLLALIALPLYFLMPSPRAQSVGGSNGATVIIDGHVWKDPAPTGYVPPPPVEISCGWAELMGLRPIPNQVAVWMS